MKIIRILIIMISVNLYHNTQLAQDKPFDKAQDKQKVANQKVDERLIDAVRTSGIEEIQKLLNKKSIDINAQDKDGYTAIAWAVKNNNLAIVNLLLNYNANVNIQNIDGYTALMWASRALIKQEIFNLLLNHAAKINIINTDGATALIMASKSGNQEKVKLLIDHGANVNIKENTRGYTSLMFASERNHIEVVKLLLNHPKIDVNITDNNGDTAFILAAERNFKEIVKLLLDHNVNTIIKNNYQQTALSLALERKHLEIVKLIEVYQNEYLPYKIKELNKLRSEAIGKTTKLLPEVINIINEYALEDEDLSNKNLLSFTKFLQQKEKKESTSKESTLKTSSKD